MRAYGAAAAAVLLLVTLTGCAKNCTDVYADNGIEFDLSSVAAPLRSQAPLTISGCAGDACTTAVRTKPDLMASEGVVFLRVDQGVDGDTPLRATVEIAGRDGVVLYQGDGEITPRKYEPNGPGCGPVAWQTTVTPQADGSLAQSP